jgi:hypothetical protein
MPRHGDDKPAMMPIPDDILMLVLDETNKTLRFEVIRYACNSFLRARSETRDSDLSCLFPLAPLSRASLDVIGGKGKGAYDEKKKAWILEDVCDETNFDFSAAAEPSAPSHCAFIPEA